MASELEAVFLVAEAVAFVVLHRVLDVDAAFLRAAAIWSLSSC